MLILCQAIFYQSPTPHPHPPTPHHQNFKDEQNTVSQTPLHNHSDHCHTETLKPPLSPGWVTLTICTTSKKYFYFSAMKMTPVLAEHPAPKLQNAQLTTKWTQKTVHLTGALSQLLSERKDIWTFRLSTVSLSC